jgi:hypothetical protein
MSLLLILGKLLIAIGLCFQAYTLCQEPASITAFNSHLKKSL